MQPGCMPMLQVPFLRPGLSYLFGEIRLLRWRICRADLNFLSVEFEFMLGFNWSVWKGCWKGWFMKMS